jgi:energy-converting hydrogenase A subunit M
MGRRQRLISNSILRAIFFTESVNNDKIQRPGLLARILAFFSVFQLTLARYRDHVFKKLRNEIWHIEEEEYIESFRSPSKGKRTDLKSVGDLGYSGSVGETHARVVRN